MTRRAPWLVIVPVLGAVALVAGAVVWLSTPVSFGTFAYAPLRAETFFPAQFWIGPSLCGIGIALLAGWAGFLLGRRRRG
jgi:hypothetical protein